MESLQAVHFVQGQVSIANHPCDMLYFVPVLTLRIFKIATACFYGGEVAHADIIDRAMTAKCVELS